jgi:hypothetical protein
LAFHKGKTLSEFEDKTFQFAQNSIFQIVFPNAFPPLRWRKKDALFRLLSV